MDLFDIGASQIQTSFPAAQLPGIDAAYMTGLHKAFALAVPMAGVATLVALAQKWFRLSNPKKEAAKEEGARAEKQE